MNHTPGPWSARGRSVTTLNVDPPSGAESRVVAVTGQTSRHLEQAEADARLIAAAPDLLAALGIIREGSRMVQSDDPEISRWLDRVHERASAAIAKAKGSDIVAP